MKLLTKVNAIFDRTVDLLAFLAVVLIFFLMLMVATEVLIMRFLLDNPQTWVTDIAIYSLLFITFLGTAWVLKRERHIKMDLVLARLNPRGQLVLNMINSIIGAIICLVLAWYGTRASWDAFQLGRSTKEALDLPMAPILAIIPVGSFLLFIEFLREANRYLRGWREAINREM